MITILLYICYLHDAFETEPSKPSLLPVVHRYFMYSVVLDVLANAKHMIFEQFEANGEWKVDQILGAPLLVISICWQEFLPQPSSIIAWPRRLVGAGVAVGEWTRSSQPFGISKSGRTSHPKNANKVHFHNLVIIPTICWLYPQHCWWLFLLLLVGSYSLCCELNPHDCFRKRVAKPSLVASPPSFAQELHAILDMVMVRRFKMLGWYRGPWVSCEGRWYCTQKGRETNEQRALGWIGDWTMLKGGDQAIEVYPIRIYATITISVRYCI